MIPLGWAQLVKGLEPDDSVGGEGTIVRRVCSDSRDVMPDDLFFALRGPTHDGHAFIKQAAAAGAAACVVDRVGAAAYGPLPLPSLTVDDTTAALGRLATWYRHHVMPVGTCVVAVTGSNGKTTTKRMIDHVLGGALQGRGSPRSFNNHIGVPLTLLSAEADDRYLVVEIGSNHPGEVAALARWTAPQVGVITSIGEAHLEGLGGLSGVMAEKLSLLDHVHPYGLGVVNTDRAGTMAYLERRQRVRLVTFGFGASARLRVERPEATITGTTFELEGRHRVELCMPGKHHATNAVAAFAVGRWFGLPPEVIIERLRTFEPAAGRTCRFQWDDVTVIDDTYNANPSSVSAAVEALSLARGGRRWFVLGDMLELGPGSEEWHSRVVQQVHRAPVDCLIAVGALTAGAARDVFAGEPERLACCADAEAAAQVLVSRIQPGDTVWLKGSRAMQLDRTVDYLRRHQPCRAAVA